MDILFLIFEDFLGMWKKFCIYEEKKENLGFWIKYRLGIIRMKLFEDIY